MELKSENYQNRSNYMEVGGEDTALLNARCSFIL